MNQEIRNKLRNVVTQCRKLLEDSVSQELEGKYGIFAKKDQVTADPNTKMIHLTEEEQGARRDILDHFGHIKARGFRPKEALNQLVREIAFTHLNRLCAYKMMEAREVYVGGQKFREAVSRGINSNGVKFYLVDHPEEERLFNTGHQDVAYRHFLDWLGGLLSDEIGVLFNPNDPANRLYPRQKTLDEVLDLLNGGVIKPEELELKAEWARIWSQDETIGWVYQYFTPKELRDQARKESTAPRNSYELAFRNQFFTPRYVVEFLTDNTLGRIWYEMRKGDTRLPDQCRYMVRRPTEIFLNESEQAPTEASSAEGCLSQEELLKLPVYIPYRAKKDPREIKILDPACGSGHFLLYCFDLLLTIYEEAYADPELGPVLQKDYPKLEDLRRDTPRLILAHNVHGIDIDLRCSQIAALALWLRSQRAYQDLGLKKDRPRITRSNLVCAEPMPGEEHMLTEFVGQIQPKLLGQLVQVVFDKMRLAGEAGSLLKIEEDIRDAVAEARGQWMAGPVSIQQSLFDDGPLLQQRFDFSGITENQFFEQAETKVVEALRKYAEGNTDRLQRRLFADDTVRGLAFVDLCRNRFDVIVMNPPFGEYPINQAIDLNRLYPEAQKYLYAAFCLRALTLTTSTGMIGSLANRGGFFISTYEGWRDRCLLGKPGLETLVDLGYAAIDEAVVELAAYVTSQAPTGVLVAFNLLHDSEQESVLTELCAQPLTASLGKRVQLTRLSSFRHLPTHPLCYWIEESLRVRLVSFPPFQNALRVARQGLATTDDFRFLRLVWESPSSQIGKGRRWAFFVKGGEYAPFYDDIHLLINWQDEGKELKDQVESLPNNSHWSRRIANVNYYFKWGLTYPETTVSDFAPRIMPENCIFSATGQAIFFPEKDEAYAFLGVSLSSPYKLLLDLFVGSGGAAESGGTIRHYKSGLVNILPYPKDISRNGDLAHLGRACVLAVMRTLETEETSRLFISPWKESPKRHSLRSLASLRTQRELERARTVFELCSQMNALVEESYGFNETSKSILDECVRVPIETMPKDRDFDLVTFHSLASLPTDLLVDEVARRKGATRQITKLTFWADRRIELMALALEKHPDVIIDELQRTPARKGISNESRTVRDALSYLVGLALGRWDVHLHIQPAQRQEPPDPFDPIPANSPGMLQGPNGNQLMETPEAYPVRISWDGVLVDDIEHPEDIVMRVRESIEGIWENHAEAIEEEACEILGVKDLRDYFRKSSKGGFWDDHVARYSKSRRKAPIYWLLQSSKKSYGLWLYYHRIDKDLLYKALVNYVEPKTRLEGSRLETLRSQKAVVGGSGKEAKRLAKEVDAQEDYISELRDFEDKLRRAANLHLEPDLNDGVVLNVASLHELVPWKEAKNYWDELLEGEYGWSSIGKQLRQKGLVK